MGKPMVASFKTKADAKRAIQTAKDTGRLGSWVVLRVLSDPQPVYRRWEFGIEVAS